MTNQHTTDNSSGNVIDIDEIIKEWLRHFGFSKEVASKINIDMPNMVEINYKNLVIRHQDIEHEVNKDPLTPNKTPSNYVLFSSVFSNNTDAPQCYNLKTERRTKSTCKVTVTKGITRGGHLDIKIMPPNPIIEANAGFKTDFTLTKAAESTFEEELVWSLDSQLQVPPKFKIKADLVIKEAEYDGSFRIETSIEGRLSISLRNKVTGEIATVVNIPDIRDVLKVEHGFIPVSAGKVKFVTTGTCHSRYGIEQHVDLNQCAL